jgi:putative transposase
LRKNGTSVPNSGWRFFASMLDDPSDLTEELTQDLDSLYLSESNFEVEPSQILLETADKHKLKFNLIQ